MDSDDFFYHGSFSYFKKIDLSKSKPFRDFGQGFYVTSIFEQAALWACKNRQRAWREKQIYLTMPHRIPDTYIYKYKLITRTDILKKEFNDYSQEWLKLVSTCRNGGKPDINYDIVIGPMADGKTQNIIKAFSEGIITGEEALEKIRFHKPTNQLVFKSNKALECLRHIKTYVL